MQAYNEITIFNGVKVVAIEENSIEIR